MAIEEIVSRIKQDAHRKAEAEIAEARDQATSYKRDFERELEHRKEGLQRELEADIQSKTGIILSEARREARDSALRVKDSIIQDCINEALKNLRELPREEYRGLLLDLIEKASQQVGGRCLVSLTRSGDRELLEGSSGFDLTEEIVPGSGGVVVHSLDRKLRVNNTFEGILLRKRGEIRNLAARMLYS
jgi:vacuolar-type H+-ATPase subunit E/Vma4